MLVTFISQCEKKALPRTRRILDSFANRIGDNTWQTPITQAGLEAVHKLLRASATKSTAVSCHQVRSRLTTQLIWIVGNKNKFNQLGIVPVNYTEKDMLTMYKEDWNFLPIIEALTVFAALMHDFGKANSAFQEKIKPENKKSDQNKLKPTNKKPEQEPIRHEWISLLFLAAIVDGRTDAEWLADLCSDDIDAQFGKLTITDIHNPFANFSPIAILIGWLIVTHHRLPIDKENDNKGNELTLKTLLASITKQWGYENHPKDFKQWFKCTEIPSKSLEWQQAIKKCAIQLTSQIPQIKQLIADNNFRIVLNYCRLCLMLGDHYYSSQPQDKNWHSSSKLYANTDGNKQLKQQLDEHLVGVANQAKRNVGKLPEFEGLFNPDIRATDKQALQQKSPAGYEWQDKAVSAITKWKQDAEQLTTQKIDKHQFGFFAVNMASTGKGKTYANAKIMQALSADENSLRYILALGLRTLTLQTGNEYKTKIGLTDQELAVIIGSQAVLNLHKQNANTDGNSSTESAASLAGSESAESLNDNQVIFTNHFPEQGLDTVLTKSQDKNFLYAPVLVCTIDHIIQATEKTRGGKYILPSLRLMSSDLVIDEVDDFDGDDLIAIGRLIHLAGMLGRKVMISSATIPPAMAEGYFNAYQSGWNIFAKMRNKTPGVGCAWIDEFNTKVATFTTPTSYRQQHDAFINSRINKLNKEPAKRRANIATCTTQPDDYFAAITEAAITKHHQHHFTDPETKITISIGVIRVANVDPCINLTKHLLSAPTKEDISIKAMAYHSRQVLLMRHRQEQYLDKILKRNQGNQHIIDDEEIRRHIDDTLAKEPKTKHIIFIVVATPVEEVGRDHDFDWAVIEPSSYRSFIQMAGRVLRHRTKHVAEPNIAIMQYNLRALESALQGIAFQWPGYQRKDDDLLDCNIEKIVDGKALQQRLDASTRIQATNHDKHQQKGFKLAELEHYVIADLLTNYQKKGPKDLQGWLASTSAWWLTGKPQQLVRFRGKSNDDPMLFVSATTSKWSAEADFTFYIKDNKGNAVEGGTHNITIKSLTELEQANLWLPRDYAALLQEQAQQTTQKAGAAEIKHTALVYGELKLPLYGKQLSTQQFIYYEQLGLAKS